MKPATVLEVFVSKILAKPDKKWYLCDVITDKEKEILTFSVKQKLEELR